MLFGIYRKLDYVKDTEEIIELLENKMRTVSTVEFSKIPIRNKQSGMYKILQNCVSEIRIVDDTMVKKSAMWKYFVLWFDVNDVTSRVSFNVAQDGGVLRVMDDTWSKFSNSFVNSFENLDFIPVHINSVVWK